MVARVKLAKIIRVLSCAMYVLIIVLLISVYRFG